jgi:hypothetical protein
VGNGYFDEPQLDLVKVGVGGEFFLETVIFYVIPASFRVGYARGLMEGGGNHFHFVLGNRF